MTVELVRPRGAGQWGCLADRIRRVREPIHTGEAKKGSIYDFEAISSRPLVLHGVATHTQHAGQTRLTITSLYAKQSAIQAVLTSLAGFLRTLKATAEQWTDAERLRAILTRAFAKFIFPTAGPPALPTSETAAT